MEELIKKIQETVGLSAEDAQKTVATTINFIKEKLPAGLSDKLEDVLNGNLNLANIFGGGNAANPSSNPLDKLNDIFK